MLAQIRTVRNTLANLVSPFSQKQLERRNLSNLTALPKTTSLSATSVIMSVNIAEIADIGL